jgi:hypothetical protein
MLSPSLVETVMLKIPTPLHFSTFVPHTQLRALYTARCIQTIVYDAAPNS